MLSPNLPRPPHKTGTLLGDVSGKAFVVNDVGIVELPNQQGHLSLAIFVKSSRAALADVESGISQVARTLVDFFTLTP